MTLTAIQALDRGNTADLLKEKLGDCRNWQDLIDDMRRGKADFHGLILLPVARVRARGAAKPYYALESVLKFIKDALEIIETPIDPEKIKVSTLVLDTADKKFWRVREVSSASMGAARAL